MECINCFTDFTPLWRKGYCNACYIYYKRQGVHKNVEAIYAKILCSMNKTNSS